MIQNREVAFLLEPDILDIPKQQAVTRSKTEEMMDDMIYEHLLAHRPEFEARRLDFGRGVNITIDLHDMMMRETVVLECRVLEEIISDAARELFGDDYIFDITNSISNVSIRNKGMIYLKVKADKVLPRKTWGAWNRTEPSGWGRYYGTR